MNEEHKNIDVKKYAWCKDSECKCKQWQNGEFPYKELYNNLLCYESRMLLDWKAKAGMDRKEGDRKGRCRRLVKDVKNGLCVLTTVLPNHTEEERIIFGVFLIDYVFVGDEVCEEGFVQCTTNKHIELTPIEAQNILFWNYYFNNSNPLIIKIGSGLFRYLNDFQAAQILRDIVIVKKGTSEEQHSKEIFNEYCEIKHLNQLRIPDNNGALTRI
jgi:hypothetical protein